MELFKIILVAALCEATWETIKMTWQNGKISLDRIGALLLGILLALATKMDILTLAGLHSAHPVVGIICTGIVVSRGANFVHDLLNIMNNAQSSQRIKMEKNTSDK